MKPPASEDLSSQVMAADSSLGRAARAKLVEETSYKLTDLFTVIHGQAQILDEKLPEAHRGDLRTIRDAVMRGMEFNKRLLWAARECRREIGA